MDITIQHPWFRRALGSVHPARLFDQFFGEGIFDYDFFPYTSSTISPYYRHSLFRSLLDSSHSGISEVTASVWIQQMDSWTVFDLIQTCSLTQLYVLTSAEIPKWHSTLFLLLLQVRSDRDKFTVYLDVKHFSPDEINVKVTDDYVEIQGKHGERQVKLL